jgi:hypothetical protein
VLYVNERCSLILVGLALVWVLRKNRHEGTWLLQEYASQVSERSTLKAKTAAFCMDAIAGKRVL